VTQLSVRAPRAEAVMLCLFDGEVETRVPMLRQGDDWLAKAPSPGTRYGLRAAGDWANLLGPEVRVSAPPATPVEDAQPPAAGPRVPAPPAAAPAR
jgi:hypothetical protein